MRKAEFWLTSLNDEIGEAKQTNMAYREMVMILIICEISQ